MNARQLIEARYRSVGICFDPHGLGYLGSDGVWLLPGGSSDQGVADYFMARWGEHKPNRDEILADPKGTFLRLIETYGMIFVVVRPSGCSLLCAYGRPVKLTKAQLVWLKSNIAVENNDPLTVTYIETGEARGTEESTIGAVLYGIPVEKEANPGDEPEGRKKKWKAYGTEDDENFAKTAEERAELASLNAAVQQSRLTLGKDREFHKYVESSSNPQDRLVAEILVLFRNSITSKEELALWLGQENEITPEGEAKAVAGLKRLKVLWDQWKKQKEAQTKPSPEVSRITTPAAAPQKINRPPVKINLPPKPTIIPS